MVRQNERLIQQHWLYQWIDEEGVKTPGNYLKAIRKRGAFDRLRELSDSTFLNAASQRGNASTSVLASRRLDLSGALTCPHFECMAPIVDNVFGRVWHYFDSVVIDEGPLDRTLYSGNDIYDLQQIVQLFLYLRNIGAEKYLQFTQKVSGLCSEHFRQYAEEERLGIDVLFDKNFEREVVQRLTSEGVFHFYSDNDSWRYEIRHPDMGILNGQVDHSDTEHKPSKEDAARSAFGDCCAGLISDVSASRALGLPLLETAENSWISSSLQGDKLNDRVVALNLRLPVLTNVSVKEILRYRDEHSASFELFREALRDAIRKQIELSGSDSPQAIADAVVAEHIRPRLAELDVQLSGIRKTLARKAGANVAVGSAAVSVGLVEGLPLIVGVTASAVAASVWTSINKRADDRQKAEESGWYFLWKARTSHRR